MSMNDNMNILVFNCGSSSLKYRLISMPGECELAGGEAQRIGPPTLVCPSIRHRCNGVESVVRTPMENHTAAFDKIMDLLSRHGAPAPDILGHRLVHGGGVFSEAVRIDAQSLKTLSKIQNMAPLHNPPATELIKSVTCRHPGLPQAAVFDTGFHSNIPDYASAYALPGALTDELGLRKFGFHGTSHRYVAEETARFMGTSLEKFTAVICHLGSGGASMCAVENGRSVDNTMGYSPLQGLVMSTRCGDLDPAIVLRFIHAADGAAADVEKLLNKESGVLGMSGVSGDIRDVFNSLQKGGKGKENEAFWHALQVYLWRIKKYLGAYLFILNSPQAVVFTDTIGETMPGVREAICEGMECFGLKIDRRKNTAATDLPADVAQQNSVARIVVMPTNEELAIARRTYEVFAETDCCN